VFVTLIAMHCGLYLNKQTVAMVEMNTEYIYYVEPIMNSTLEWLDEWHVA